VIPELEQSGWVVAAYWLSIAAIAVVVLVQTTAFWADDGPGTLVAAIRTTLLTGLAVFLTYDLSAYIFARSMESPQLGISFPADYGYWNWLREPLCLKWQVLGFVPLVRYLPVLFALTVGGAVQVLLWGVPFRQGVAIFISQIILNVFAMALVSLVFVFFIGMGEAATAPAGNAPRRPGGGPRNRPEATQANRPAAPGLSTMQRRVHELGARKGPFARGLRDRWESLNRLFEPGYAAVRPVTRYLPLPVQDFLHGGGWLLAGPGVAAFAWYGWRNHRQRSRRPPRETAPPS